MGTQACHRVTASTSTSDVDELIGRLARLWLTSPVGSQSRPQPLRHPLQAAAREIGAAETSENLSSQFPPPGAYNDAVSRVLTRDLFSRLLGPAAW